MADRFEGIKHLVGGRIQFRDDPVLQSTRRAGGKDFMRDDLTYGADSVG